MAESAPNERSAPEFQLNVGGSDLTAETSADVKSVVVQEDVQGPGAFTIEIINWDMNKLRMKWSDGDQFVEGKNVEISMGYRDHLEKVISGEITGLQLRIHAKETPMLQIRGYDRRHRLMHGKKTKTFLQVKDSDIARQVATEAGLTADTEDTKVSHDYVIQHNQTDLEFLTARATRIGFEISIDDRTIKFRSHQTKGTEALSLDRELDLIEFYPRLSTMNQTTDVEVRGWDVKNKANIQGRASAGGENTKMAGTVSGPSAIKKAFGSSSTVVVNAPVGLQGIADQMAQARLNQMALAYISGEGVCIGNTKLRSGTNIKVENLGTRFSGLYYVMATTHRYSPTKGYRTGFTVRRNAT